MAIGPVNIPGGAGGSGDGGGTADSFFEIDTDGGIMPCADPVYSDAFELDSNGDVMPLP